MHRHSKLYEGRHLPPLVFFYALAFTTPAGADGWGSYARAEVMAYSEPVAIETAFDDWKGRYSGDGDRQWAHLWAEAGFRNERWSVGALYRREADLRFSEDTAEFYHHVQNDLELPAGRRYELDLSGYHFELAGMRFGRRIELNPRLTLSLGATVFGADGLQRADVTGAATASSAYEYAYEGYVDYAYEEDLLFDRTSDSPTGYGASLDVGVQWQQPGAFVVNLSVIDALGVIRWEDVPVTVAEVHSEQIGTDENGFVEVDPVLSGREGYRGSYDQKLKPRAQLSASAAVANGFWADAELMCRQHACLYGLGASAYGVRVLYWPQFDGVGLAVQRGRFEISLSADALELSKANAMFISIGYNLP